MHDEPDESGFEPSEADLAIDRCRAALAEIKQILRFKAAVKALGVPWENVQGPKRSLWAGDWDLADQARLRDQATGPSQRLQAVRHEPLTQENNEDASEDAGT